MSLRRPTVACPLFTFDISPLCDVAQMSDCGTLVIYFQYKPFMWCRSDVRLWHALPFIFYYKPFMWCRLDARLRHCYFICILSRSHSDTRLAFSTTLGFREDYRPTSLLFPMHCYPIVWVRSINLFICIMFTFVISYVRTVLRVHSKYSPSLLIWPDVDEGDLMDEEFDSESDA